MDSVTLIGTVTLVHLLALISPGPDFLMCVRNSLTYSRKTGMWTAVGFGLGIAVHIFYSLAGLTVLISQSILFFNAIKLLGAAYLIYIGIQSLRSKSAAAFTETPQKKDDISALSALKIGFLTNVLNPKATLFFLSLFILVLSPDTPGYIMGVVSVIMVVNTILWFSLVAFFITQDHLRRVFGRFQHVFNKTLSGLLIGLGIKVALTTNK